MSSSLRNIQRRNLKKMGKYPKRSMPVIVDDKGYTVLHATKGWQRFSFKRVRATQRMAQLLGA